jgi:hypothetical protein
MLMLGAANPLPPTSGRGRQGPVGSFWYRFLSPPDETSAVFEWYVQAQHLGPNRAYRVELLVDDHTTYEIGNIRADRLGDLTVHGSLSRFEDRYCVAQPAVPISLIGHHDISVRVKADGSGSGGGTGGVVGPERTLDCDGNGDGVFDYWLVSRGDIHLGGTQTAAR